MKKLYILGLAACLTTGLSSCNDDTKPRLDTSKEYEFVLNLPPYANQFIDLSTNGNMEFTVSQPNYGLTLETNYELEISLSPDFQPLITTPVVDSEGVEHIVPGSTVLTYESSLMGVLTYTMSSFATAINEMYGEFDEEAYYEKGAFEGPVYVRAHASVGDGRSSQLTAVTSNTIILANVQSFADFKPDVPDYMSVPGDANGWSQPKNLIWGINPDESGTDADGNPLFKGFAYISGAFKITDGDWDDAGNWGASEEGLQGSNGVYSGELIQNTQTNYNTDGTLPAGLYYITVALNKYKVADGASSGIVTLTYIESVAVCGDFNGWDAGNPVELTPSEDFSTFTGSAAVTEGGWKFVFNKGWGINLGPSKAEDIEGLWFDGNNAVEAGSNITLKLAGYPWTYDVQ